MADYTPRMKAHYDDVVVKGLTEKFGYTNHMALPKIEKIVLNMGVGEGSQDKKKVTTALEEMPCSLQRGAFGQRVRQDC